MLAKCGVTRCERGNSVAEEEFDLKFSLGQPMRARDKEKWRCMGE
jgi:hypothetical protein